MAISMESSTLAFDGRQRRYLLGLFLNQKTSDFKLMLI